MIVGIEEKAKLTAQIHEGYDKCDYVTYHGGQKWVPLEVAQDAIKEEADAWAKHLKEVLEERDSLLERINSALKVLEEYSLQIDEWVEEELKATLVGKL